MNTLSSKLLLQIIGMNLMLHHLTVIIILNQVITLLGCSRCAKGFCLTKDRNSFTNFHDIFDCWNWYFLSTVDIDGIQWFYVDISYFDVYMFVVWKRPLRGVTKSHGACWKLVKYKFMWWKDIYWYGRIAYIQDLL